ncbi:MAG: hypothetical protein ACTHK7_16010 [Aureliella sp.]
MLALAWASLQASATFGQVSVPSSLQDAIPSAEHPAPSASGHRSNPAEDARLLMERALLSGVWGPPVHCRIRQEITLLDRRLHGVGLYARGRSGFGEMKMTLKVVAADHLNVLHQVSDGRMLHTLQIQTPLNSARQASAANGEAAGPGSVEPRQSTTEGWRVDLGRVREYLVSFTEQDRVDPQVALHLAIGGQNEKLRALCQQYKWVTVQPGKLTQPGNLGEIDVWWLRGERATEPGPLRGLAEIDASLAGADSAGLAPDHAKIAIGRTPPLQFWLYHVEESRRERTDGQGPKGYSLVSKIDYYQPIIQEMPPAMFSDSEAYASSVERIVDETRRYLPPTRQAEAQTAARPGHPN